MNYHFEKNTAKLWCKLGDAKCHGLECDSLVQSIFGTSLLLLSHSFGEKFVVALGEVLDVDILVSHPHARKRLLHFILQLRPLAFLLRQH